MRIEVPTPLRADAALPARWMDDGAISTPALLVDLDVVTANIQRMADFARRAGLDLRPHVKTHKSLFMARLQLEAGAKGICVAKVGEAEVFAAGGIDDITIAYPVVGRLKLERLATVARQAELTLVADSEAIVEGYEEVAASSGLRLGVLVEVDTGMHRVGARPELVFELVRRVAKSSSLRFQGLLTHAGQAHGAADPLGVALVAREEARILGGLREAIEDTHIDVPVVSAGSTLTSPYLSAADGITEIRPGTYIYNDLRTVASWSCSYDQLAVSALATVVSVDGDRVTLDAGNKTLTMTNDPVYRFGHVLGRPEITLERLSEEHGVATMSQGSVAVGERLRVLPIHVCVWMDLQPEVYGIRGDAVVERIAVSAFRRSF